MLDIFNQYFFQYLSGISWWQGLLFIATVLFILIVGKFWRNVLAFISIKMFGEKSETLYYRMFWGISNDAINMKMKDEIRRSFKENGFYNLDEKDFLQYTQNQSKNLIAILRNHVINLYPSDNRGMIVSMEEVLEYIEKEESKFASVILEIYMEAKNFKKQDDDSISEIDKKFEEEIDTFVKDKTGSSCNNCFPVLFGKREITENKKAKFKTLKSQMNFAEQKMTALHSSLIAFYSEKINENKKIK